MKKKTIIKSLIFLIIFFLVTLILIKGYKKTKINQGYEYIRPIHQSGILYHQWEEPEDIYIVSMMSYLSSNLDNSEKYWNEQSKKYVVPFDLYYKIATEHFDISEDYLKAYKEYSKDKDAFITTLGYGGYSIIDVVDVDINGNQILITLNDYEDLDKTKLLFTSILTVEKRGKKFKYKSNIIQ